MTDRVKFYKLASNIIEYRDSVMIEKNRIRFRFKQTNGHGDTLDLMLTLKRKKVYLASISLTIENGLYICIPRPTKVKMINTIIDRIKSFFSQMDPWMNPKCEILEGIEDDE